MFNHKLTETQIDILTWIGCLWMNKYSSFESDSDVDKLIELNLVTFKQDYNSFIKHSKPNGECYITQEGKEYITPESLLRFFKEVIQVNGEPISLEDINYYSNTLKK